MKKLRNSIQALVVGMASLILLFLVLLYPAGGAHAKAMGWNAVALTGSLLYHQMLPGSLLIFVASGMVSAAVRTNLGKRWIIAAVPFVLALALIFIQGFAVKSAVAKYERVLPAVKADVSRNLVVMPGDTEWKPTFTGYFRPKLSGVYGGTMLAGAHVVVDLTDDADITSAQLTILDVMSLGFGRQDAIRVLRKYGVRGQMFKTLSGQNFDWQSEQGRYSLRLKDY